MQQRLPKSVRIDPWTLNVINSNERMTFLELKNQFIWLDHPKRDSERVGPQWYGTGGFFCSNWEYKRNADLTVPGHSLYMSEILSEEDLQHYCPYEIYQHTRGNL